MPDLIRTALGPLLLLPLMQVAQAQDSSANQPAGEEVPEVFPTESRDNPVWQQDDHIHTTPDAAVRRFKVLDQDSDRRLQWDEVQAVDMDKHIFRTLDTDGSDSLDREEYIAISPSPENQYSNEGMAEP